MEVIQNIQDVSYNCSNLGKVKDELETTTIFTPHESDSKTKCEDNEVTASVNELAEMLKQLDDTRLEYGDPDKRISLRREFQMNEFPLSGVLDSWVSFI